MKALCHAQYLPLLGNINEYHIVLMNTVIFFCFVLNWIKKNFFFYLRDIYDYFCLVNKGRVRISLVFYTKLYSLTLKIVALTFINETNIIIILFYIHV